jgi:hypothetical protein
MAPEATLKYRGPHPLAGGAEGLFGNSMEDIEQYSMNADDEQQNTARKERIEVPMICDTRIDCEQLRMQERFLNKEISEAELNGFYKMQAIGGAVGVGTLATGYAVYASRGTVVPISAKALAIYWVSDPESLRNVPQQFVKATLKTAGWSEDRYRGRTIGAWKMQMDFGKKGSKAKFGGLAVIQWSPEGNSSHGIAYWKVSTMFSGRQWIPYMRPGNVPTIR